MATPPTSIIHNDNNNGDTPENHDIRITPLIDSTNDDHGCIMTLFENVLGGPSETLAHATSQRFALERRNRCLWTPRACNVLFCRP